MTSEVGLRTKRVEKHELGTEHFVYIDSLLVCCELFILIVCWFVVFCLY